MPALFEFMVNRAKRIPVACWIAFSLLDALFSLSLVAGGHVVITGGKYASIEQNYIAPYGFLDIALFLFALVAFGLVGAWALCALVSSNRFASGESATAARISPLHYKPILAMAGILFVAYIPYLLAYWPGLIFGDSLSSIGQAVGWYPYSNHHPLVYTLCVKLCFSVAHAFGLSNSAACVLYSLVQMSLMSLGLSALIQWAVQRSGCRVGWRALLVAVFALSPYIASYPIAMWKDPLFSLALALLCVLLFDLVASSGRIACDCKYWSILFAACLLCVVSFRSNGVFVIALVALGLFFLAMANKALRSALFKAASASLLVVILALVVTGPVYSAAGVQRADTVEALGIPLGQMARVVATGGEMSADDAAYMNELLPLGDYSDAYSPTCIDSLKWNDDFNSEALSNGFWGHWVSMLLKNPVCFIEAWELQMVGYWSADTPAVVGYSANIGTGDPRFSENSEELSMLGITSRNFLGGPVGYGAMPVGAPFVPASWVLWLSLFVALAFFALGRGRLALALVPLFALVLSLLVASPIWYWSRYVAALQFVLPCIIAMCIVGCKSGYGNSSNGCSRYEK